MREWILVAASEPWVGAVALAVGVLGIIAEFLRPGRVIPGVLGGVLALLGLAALLPEHAVVALLVTMPLVLLALGLLRVAGRARHIKSGRE